MDQLVAPRPVGPLSELSMSVRVQGQCGGATVRVKSLTRQPPDDVVAEGVAQSGDQWFPLLPGVHLSAQDQLVASQELAGFDPSPPPAGDLWMGVQPKPQSANEIGHIGFAGHVYECGLAVALRGAIPGANVELRVLASGQTLGQRIALEGNANIGIDPPGHLTSGEPVAARQVVPGLAPGPDTKCTPARLPVQSGEPLPAPVLQPPIHVCDSSVVATDVIDGAKVRIVHSLPGLQLDLSWWPIGGSGRVDLRQPLDPSDRLKVGQEVDLRCEHPTTYSDGPPVQPLEPLPPPSVHPPCARSANVVVENCRPGARVRLMANGKTWVGDVPADQTWHCFTIEPLDLAKGKTVSATQEKCGKRSAPSPDVQVNPHEDVRDPPTVVPTLYECARCVSVRDVRPGATLQVWAKSANANWEGPVSDFVVFPDKQGTIGVTPYLRAGDEVYVVQWACSYTGLASGPVQVQKHPAPAPPDVVPPYSGDTRVKVKGVIPGAFVEVEIKRRNTSNWVFAGAAVADTLTSPTLVSCRPAMNTGDQVHARQSLCGMVTEFGPGRDVLVRPPLKPDTLSPASGAKDVPVQPTLSWRDPGAHEERRATSFDVQIWHGNQLVRDFSCPAAVTTYSLPAPALAQNTSYTWQVRGVNSTTSSNFAEATFTTVAPPPPGGGLQGTYWFLSVGSQSFDLRVIFSGTWKSGSAAGGKTSFQVSVTRKGIPGGGELPGQRESVSFSVDGLRPGTWTVNATPTASAGPGAADCEVPGYVVIDVTG